MGIDTNVDEPGGHTESDHFVDVLSSDVETALEVIMDNKAHPLLGPLLIPVIYPLVFAEIRRFREEESRKVDIDRVAQNYIDQCKDMLRLQSIAPFPADGYLVDPLLERDKEETVQKIEDLLRRAIQETNIPFSSIVIKIGEIIHDIGTRKEV